MNTLKETNYNDLYELSRIDAHAAKEEEILTPFTPEEISQIDGGSSPVTTNVVSQEPQAGEAQAAPVPQDPNAPTTPAAAPIPAVEDIANAPSDLAIKRKEEAKEKKTGVMDVVEWGLNPLMAIGDAALAPIANRDYPDDSTVLGRWAQDFKISGKAFLDRITSDIGDDHPDYAGQIVNRHFPEVPEWLKGTLSMGLSAVSDPTIVLGLGAAKVVQRGMLAKKMQVMAAGEDASKLTNKGIWEEGINELFGITGAWDETKLTEAGKLARKVDRGDKGEALEELQGMMSDTRSTQVANAVDVDAHQELIDEYVKVFGDDKAPLIAYENTKLQREAMKAGIVSNEVPKLAYNINLHHLNTTKDAKVLISQTTKMFEDFFKKNAGTLKEGQISDLAQNEKLGELLGRRVTNFSAPQAYALRQGLIASSSTFLRLAKKASISGSNIDKLGASRAFFLNMEFQRKVSGVASEAGRVLRQQRMDVTTTRGTYGQIKSMLGELDTDHEFMDMMLEIAKDDAALSVKETQGLMTKGQRGWLRRGYDGFYEGYVNAILSGPLTHIVNSVSNTAMLLMRPTEQYLTALTPAVRSLVHPSKGVRTAAKVKAASDLKQANAMVAGLVGGVADAMKVATRFAEKSDISYPEVLERQHELARQRVKPAITAENFNATGVVGRFVDIVGNIVRMPGNALLKEDKAFKLINYRMTVNQEASKMATELGKNSDDVSVLYNTLRRNPDEVMEKQAVDMASLYTFTNKLEGGALNDSLGSFEKAFRLPGLNLIIPFFRTPMQITKFGYNNSFVGNIHHDLLTGDVFKGTAKGDVSKARMAIGTLLPVSIVGMMGDNVTGHVDMSTTQGRLEAQERPAYSFRMDENSPWHSYERLEPIKSIMGMFVNFKQTMDYLDMNDEEDRNTAVQIGQAISTAVSQTCGDNAFFEVFGNLHYILEDTTGYDSATYGDVMKDRLEKVATSVMIPNVLNQLNKTSFDDTFRMADTFIEKLKKRSFFPGRFGSKDLPVWPDAFGDPQYVPRGVGISFVNPFLTIPSRNDKVSLEMIKIEATIPNIVSKKVAYKPRRSRADSVELELTTKQRSYMGQLIGRGFKEAEGGYSALPPIRDLLSRKINDPAWKKSTDDEKRQDIYKIYSVRKKQVIDFMVKTDPELTAMYRERYQAKLDEIEEARSR